MNIFLLLITEGQLINWAELYITFQTIPLHLFIMLITMLNKKDNKLLLKSSRCITAGFCTVQPCLASLHMLVPQDGSVFVL